MAALYLIVRIAGQDVALPIATVGSVVEIEEIAPVPRVAHHVAGLFALRSRVLTVIDTGLALGFGPVARSEAMVAVIVTCEAHCYALLVESVEDVVEAPAAERCPAVLAAGWAEASLGAVRIGERLLLLLDPAALVAGRPGLAA